MRLKRQARRLVNLGPVVDDEDCGIVHAREPSGRQVLRKCPHPDAGRIATRESAAQVPDPHAFFSALRAV
jgi:hypothetical protein